MKVQIVSFHCVLRNKLGKVLSSTFNNGVITHAEGNTDGLIGLAQGLHDLKKGEKRRICLSAEQAYGFYDPKKVIELNLDEVPSYSGLKMGDQVVRVTDKGERNSFRVVQTTFDRIVLDGNHPLAGEDLVFEIEATAARDATPEEIAESSAPPVVESSEAILLH